MDYKNKNKPIEVYTKYTKGRQWHWEKELKPFIDKNILSMIRALTNDPSVDAIFPGASPSFRTKIFNLQKEIEAIHSNTSLDTLLVPFRKLSEFIAEQSLFQFDPNNAQKGDLSTKIKRLKSHAKELSSKEKRICDLLNKIRIIANLGAHDSQTKYHIHDLFVSTFGFLEELFAIIHPNSALNSRTHSNTQTNSKSSPNSNSTSTEKLCWNCGKTGHTSKECKNCSNCGRTGHKSDRCRAPANCSYCFFNDRKDQCSTHPASKCLYLKQVMANNYNSDHSSLNVYHEKICWNCGKTGHPSKECKNCPKCGRAGHKYEACHSDANCSYCFFNDRKDECSTHSASNCAYLKQEKEKREKYKKLFKANAPNSNPKSSPNPQAAEKLCWICGKTGHSVKTCNNCPKCGRHGHKFEECRALPNCCYCFFSNRKDQCSTHSAPKCVFLKEERERRKALKELLKRDLDNLNNGDASSILEKLCWNCGKTGHTSEECKNCSNCGRAGHNSEECLAPANCAYCYFSDRKDECSTHSASNCPHLNQQKGKFMGLSQILV